LIDLNIISKSIKNNKNICVAYSGGIDSTALLYASYLLKKEGMLDSIRAVHINHNLSNNCHIWEQHCKQICDQLGIKLIVKNIQVQTNKDGLESAARKARYEIFSKILNKNEQLLLGHHADDVAETILFRLFRGTGFYGLEGPKERRSLGKGNLLRPLLKFTKKELHDFIDENNVAFIEDESNKESNQDRNLIRNEIMPIINKRWKNYEKRMQNTSEIIREKQELFDQMFSQKYSSLIIEDAIPLKIFQDLDILVAKELIRYVIQRNNIALPSRKVLNEIMKTFHKSKPSELSVVKWSRADKEQSGGKIIYNSDCACLDGKEYSGIIVIDRV